ncbi:MAG TPA: hypothetical protein VFI34_02030 [Candidatus Limnocylindrales bacterium]|nr:hypothetical protein [Candidatus Limnocylindrales bacterium]
MTAPSDLAPGLDLVGQRPLLGDAPEILFRLAPGDRPLVAPGDAIVAGTTIAERLRDASVVDLGPAAAAETARAGDRWVTADRPAARVIGRPAARLRSGGDPTSGELLFEHDGRWSVATGEHPEPVDCPVSGVVRDVRSGVGIRVHAQGRALFGVDALGDPSSGRLSLGADRGDHRHGRLRPTSLDVGLAGTILVIGARVDAEALTRARAMGVRGVIVSGLAGKERRDFMASESRQRAALHRLPPFGVLVLDGAVRRPIAGPVSAVLDALAGTTVAITIDPPALVFDEPELDLAPLPDGHVRVRAGEHAGAEGRWAGPAGVRRFAGGTDLEAGWVVLDGDAPIPIPIADLERYG